MAWSTLMAAFPATLHRPSSHRVNAALCADRERDFGRPAERGRGGDGLKTMSYKVSRPRWRGVLTMLCGPHRSFTLHRARLLTATRRFSWLLRVPPRVPAPPVRRGGGASSQVARGRSAGREVRRCALVALLRELLRPEGGFEGRAHSRLSMATSARICSARLSVPRVSLDHPGFHRATSDHEGTTTPVALPIDFASV